MTNGILDSGQKIITDGLVLNLDAAQLRSYPTTGTTWTDLSGNGNNGTLVNGPTFNSGNGGSIVFDGVDDYVSLPTTNLSSLGLTGRTAKTMEIWMTCDSTANTFKFAFAIGTPGIGNAFFIGSNAATLCYGGYGDDFTVSNFYADKIGIPLHLVLTYDGTTGIGYYNGTQHASAAKTWNMGSTYFRIGQQVNDYGEFWTGKIFVARVYNRTLSAQEVLQNYNATKNRFGL